MQCSTPCFNTNLSNYSRYFCAALHLILAITEPFGLTPLHMYGMTSPSTESLHWALAIVTSGT